MERQMGRKPEESLICLSSAFHLWRFSCLSSVTLCLCGIFLVDFVRSSNSILLRQPRDVSTGRLGHGREGSVEVRGVVLIAVSEPLPGNVRNPCALSPPTAALGHAPRPLHAVGSEGVRCSIDTVGRAVKR